MESIYVILYYATAGLALFAGTALLLVRHERVELCGVKTLLIALVAATYVIGMLRLDGVDFGVYSAAFYEDPALIPDPGFRLLMVAIGSLNLPIQAMMLLIAAVTLLSLRRAANFFGVSFALLLVVYFLHLAIIRDFAQFRAGFAVSIALLGVTAATSWRKGVFYALAASMHLTSVAFIFSFEFCRWVARRERQRDVVLLMIAAIAGTTILAGSVPYLVFIDPRIEVYLEWKKQGYGIPVGQFLILFFQLFILALAYKTRSSWRNDGRLRALVLQQILGIAAFVAFADVAILAFRLSSVILSLYPVLLLAALARLRVNVDDYSVSRLATSLIFFGICCVLLARPGSFEVLGLISFGH